MPANQIVNIQAESTETFTAAVVTGVYQATGAITKGMLVVLVTAETATKPVKVKKAPHTGSTFLIGVAMNTAATGTLVQVVVNGPVQVKTKTNVVKGQFVIVDTAATHTGFGKTLAIATTTHITLVVGKVIGVWLNTLTTTTGKTWAYIYKV